MIQDGRNNLSLAYNNLNLIEKVEQDNVNVANYSYLADGTKLAATNVAGNGLIYMGSLVYRLQNDVLTLESRSFSDGRILNTANGYDIQYHLTDHLGSIRTIVDDDSDIYNIASIFIHERQHVLDGWQMGYNAYNNLGKNIQEIRAYETQIFNNPFWFSISPRLQILLVKGYYNSLSKNE